MGRATPDRFHFERELLSRGLRRFAGVDEAGRGPLAGPVVAAAVVLPLEWMDNEMPREFRELNDSKQLSAAEREHFFSLLASHPDVESCVAEVPSDVIDSINILQATYRAMNTALRGLRSVQHALVDGKPVKTLRLAHTAIVKGDALSYSIAAASVFAKVTRDRWMAEADRKWPMYGFAQHKGYPTPDHVDAIARHGPCPIHRRSFAPLRQPDPELFPE